MPIRRGRFAPQNTFLETIAQKFDHGNSNFVLGSAQEKNNYPIVYCSDGFCELTGFSRSDLMRRSCACNFLYGLESSQEDIHSIENALKTQKELKKEILFYKKNGSPFYCLLDIVPIKNEKGNVVLFLVSHKDVTKRKLSNEVHDEEQASSNGGTAPKSKLSRSRSRKFSRDVLLHLSRQYQQNNNANSKTTPRRSLKRTRSFSFNSERLPQYKTESTKKSRFLFLHYSTKKGLWDWWILVLTFYIAIMVPYNVAFSRAGKARDLIIVDMVIELFFILDIVVHFRTTYVNNAGRIVYEQKAIAVHYLKGWFVLDFLAALPFEALYFINQSWGFLVQLLKCGRLLRLFRVVRKLHRYTEYSTVLLTLLMLAFAMVAHWLACVWYVIGLEEVREKSTISWLYQFGETIHRPYVNFSLSTGPNEGAAYVTALYFTLTSMTTVGFGNVSANTNAEKAFAVIVMLIGALMHAAIFGNVAAIIQKLYANRVRYHSRANEIKQFIRVHHIDGDLSNRLEDYFHTTWSLSGGVDTREILATFPIEIQSDVCMHLYKGFLELPLFSQAPRGLVRMLSLQIRPVYVGPGEYLLMQKDVVNCVYYIAGGSMEVLQGESVAAILGKGDVFGEDISRKVPIRRSNGDVRALTYCDIYYITRDLLQDVLHLYPDFSYKFTEKLELTYDLGASERDIWRRGGLDSISEDEEENGEETSDSPETGSDAKPLPVRNRFDMKLNRTSTKQPNNFNANEPWKFYSRPKFRGFEFQEKEPLLTTPEETPSSVSNVRVSQPANKQISLSKEHTGSNEQMDSLPNLEWEHEPFTLKNDMTDGELKQVLVDSVCHEDETNENNDIVPRDLENQGQRLPTEKSYKYAKDSFLKNLRSSGEDRDCMKNDGIEEEVDHESVKEEEERDDCIGFTEFVTPSQSPRLGMKRQYTRSPTLSPTHSLNSNRSHRMRRSGTSLLDFPSSEALNDNQIFDSSNQIPHQDVRGHALTPSPGMDSPYVSIKRLFALTPPPRDDGRFSSTQDVHYASMPASPARVIGDSGSRTSLRRKGTTELTSPASSCGGLSDNRSRSTVSRRRKMSTSVPPPMVFASLVAQASKSPYADFVPPKIVRESTITCNCEEEESCSACGDNDSSGYTLNDNLSDEEEENCDPTRTDNVCGKRHENSDCEDNHNLILDRSDFLSDREDFRSQVSINHLFELNEPEVPNGLDLPSESSDCNNRRKRRLMTRESAVYSSISQLDDDNGDDISNVVNDEEMADHTSQDQNKDEESLDGNRHSEESVQFDRSDLIGDSKNETLLREADSSTLIEGTGPSERNSNENVRSEIDPPTINEDIVHSYSDQSRDLSNRVPEDIAHSYRVPPASDKQETYDIPPFFDEVIANSSNENDLLCPPDKDHQSTSILQFSSLSSLSSQPITTQHISATDLSHSVSSVGISSTDILQSELYETGPFHNRKPTISGIHSTHSLNDVSHSGSRSFAAAQAMSFSEPHLQLPVDDVLETRENDDSDYSDTQLEDIFKDVVSAKQAMERLQTILTSPEPTITSDLADTKETVQRLDQQVSHLNQDVTSLRGDVKMVLELLKGLKNGQIVST